ncbi:MAG: pyridoxine 5'-phosphate synthase [Bacteroidales bacterium]|jgi:pyridoxine 5-phosphate synthase|nr:pyridoxine 5'-phosphate synthase [Bacteroidales bacterium]MBO7284597.1 pyridoxine 5'-phosphate synthase [Bacteroidales bacterium]MBO7322381.1 pyridoxine 5'-phosphate synthase [Bacteroidales bacterium]MBQ5747421.1 pyridoxine 5'-phosphate synthase [Bacteroidales bacterium]MBQ5881744.1 pyridoxine 5'-phosphate synthase [Bacteroidales bacterium]
MTRLSVNINKFATLRNARGGNLPDVIKAALDCEKFGAEGITVHPRPDERHIRYQDVLDLKPVLTTEFNIEGNPIPSFIDLVMKVRPAQVTLVPDAENVLTSNAGWNTIENKQFLKDVCKMFKDAGIRTSIFIDPVTEMIKHAAETGCDRVELYTEAYSAQYSQNREQAIEPYFKAAQCAAECGLGLNAGHDLNLENLRYFIETIPFIDEVSIGHALISDALYLGLENTIKAYLKEVRNI